MFTNKARNIADACRFCWMCRHVCPVGLVTGREGNTPRGRGLLLSLDTRGITLTPDGYELMFQCALCNACTNDCATGYEPPIFVREARTEAIVNDCVPISVKPVLERAITGSISGKPLNEELKKSIKELKEQPTLYCIWGQRKKQRMWQRAGTHKYTEKANIDFCVLEDELDSGAHLFDLMGYTSDVQDTAKACIQQLRNTGAETIIVLDPTYARFFKHQCNEWGLMDGLTAVTATSFVSELFKTTNLRLINLTLRQRSRSMPLIPDLEEIEPARDIMKSIGIEIKEMFLNGKLTKCCGGAIMRGAYKKIADDMAKARWFDAERTQTNLLITACPCCAENFYANIPEGMEIADLFVLADKACESL